MKNVLLLASLMLVVMGSFSTASGDFLEANSARNNCSPLYGCPIDPGQCVRNPRSCGL